MGKLVLFLADGTTLDIPLDQARLTVGRRATNDVCLPYAPVSGEHALFVIVPTGVVVEDLGSTNGTIVNGKRVARQFLHDGDKVEIGRQKFVYLADANAALPPGAAGPKVERRRPRGRTRPATPDTAAPVLPPADAEPAMPESTAPDADAPATNRHVAMAARHGFSFTAPLLPPSEASLAPVAEAAPLGPFLKVVTGPNAGRFLPLTKDEALVGRVGVQVVAVRKSEGGFRLMQAEGSGLLQVNGAPVPLEGMLLKPGDMVEVAGTRLEYLVA